jgi:hypothetical protein
MALLLFRPFRTEDLDVLMKYGVVQGASIHAVCR